MQESFDDTLLGGAAAALGVLIFALPIYYVWKLVASFRREAIPRWPPIVCLSLWLLQWPFAVIILLLLTATATNTLSFQFRYAFGRISSCYNGARAQSNGPDS